jgi:cob(I)alamin adenosyltransferase
VKGAEVREGLASAAVKNTSMCCLSYADAAPITIVASMADLDDRRWPKPTLFTGQGDAGRTSLGTHADVAKTDVLIVARGDCDEANAAVSVVMAAGNLPIGVNSTLASVQNDLFDVVADLSVPTGATESAEARIQESHLSRLERAIDHFTGEVAELTDLSGQVLPGGTVAAALLYQARAVVRRAERSVWAALDVHPTSVNPLCASYLNRLSTLIFVLARGANAEHGDVQWVAGASAHAMDQEDVAETQQ